MVIAAIPTWYSGTKFRSLLEARYAKCLDGYGVRWSYEVQGYEYQGVKYLPDFYLPDMNVLLEIKGPSIPGIEKPANIREMAESGAGPRVAWWNPEVLVLVGDATGLVTVAGTDERAPLCKCRECERHFFLAETRAFDCRICKAYDGDHHLESWTSPLMLPQGVID